MDLDGALNNEDSVRGSQFAMIIDDPDSFKAWLTAKLGPLCDADPEALAKYVYALVKKDKPVEELRASMIEQLEVFLQRETQAFVSLLFKTLETQNFDLNTENMAPPPAASPVASKTSTIDVDLRGEQFSTQSSQEEADKKPLKDSNAGGGILATIASTAQNTNSLGCALLAASNQRDRDKNVRKGDLDKDDRPGRRGRRRGSSPSPERRRSRSRSFDRRRSRSRERERTRAWRNKSPPPRRYDRRSYSKSPLRRFSKSGSPQTKRISRRSYSKSPHRRYSKSRSPQSKRIRYRNRSPPLSRSRSRTRSRSRSPLIGDRKDVGTGLSPGLGNHGDTDLRNIPSVLSLDVHHPSYPRRCRDFDEKGFCVRGDLCPFDHGTDPVVLEDLQVYNGGSAPVPPLMSSGPPPLLRHPIHPPMRPPPAVNLIEYNPDAPSMEPRQWARPPAFRGPMMRGMMRGNMGRGGFPPHQRELISVMTGGPQFRHQRPNLPVDYSNQGRNTLGDVKQFDYNRLGAPRAPFNNNNKSGNTSLQLKKVPPGVNNITHLNSHFSKFGKIVNIQVVFEGDPESALITFSSHTEANIAYKSTEAVLNNRFIRVFWYNPTNNNNSNNENKTDNTPPSSRPSVLERLGDPPAKVLNNIQPSAVQQEEKAHVTLGANNTISKTLYIPSVMKKEAPKETPTVPALDPKMIQEKNELLKKKMEEVAIAKKKQQESIKAGLKLNADLRKRKTELMEKQINQQKLLIQRLEKGEVNADQKSTLMDTIKTLQDSIEKIKKDLELSIKPTLAKVAKTQVVKSHQALVKKTREETQRELLDAELDLINSQNEGKNAEELKKKVADLKLRAHSLGVSTTAPIRGAFRGRGAATLRVRGRGRGAKFLSNIPYDQNIHNVVDHRPTKVLVSGYEQDDKADVLTHFEKYGQIVDYISDDATPSLVLNFKSRKEAENAINSGRNFHDRLLSVTWATSNMNIRGGVVTKPSTPVQRSVLVMEDDEIGEEVLEEVDDDDAYVVLSPGYFPNEAELEEVEEEEDEERSWRR